MRGSFVWLAVAVAACSTPSRPAPVQPAPVVAKPAPPPAPRDPMDEPVAIDANVKTGKLPNGLTYYILHHVKPAGRVALWLAVDTGSISEDDDQRGLAHFIEHMAFNGTKRFPKTDIINFLERAGMRFGGDINAHTNFDETVYELTVPTDRPVVQQGFDMLRDIAGDITFDPVELDKERPVIMEEWRLHQGVGQRLAEQRNQLLFAGSRYAQRSTIGLPDIIKSAKRDAFWRFYKDWYRPDLMAVVVVGDIEPDQIEAEIKSRFGDLVNPAKARPLTPVAVPHDKPTKVLLLGDAEARVTTVAILDKLEHRKLITKRDLRASLIERLVHSMFTSRLAELRDEPGSPVVSTSSDRQPITRTTDVIARTVAIREGKLPAGLRLLVREMTRLRQHGFLASEFERARKTLLSRYDRIAVENKKAPLGQLAAEIVRNFTDAELMPGPERELALVHEIVPALTLDDINKVARETTPETGRLIVITAPKTVQLPTEEQVLDTVDVDTKAKMKEWTDTTPDEPLLAKLPTPGTVAKTEALAAAEATVWTLSNGIRVIVKPTQFANDSVILDGYALGGTSLLTDADFVHARFADEIIPHSGAGEFSERSVHKMLAGMTLGLGIDLDETEEHIGGNARPEDLETLFQLLYLRLTEPRHDKTAFDIWKSKRSEQARHRTDSPETQFGDMIAKTETGDHPRHAPITQDVLDKVDLKKMAKIWSDRFSDFGNYTFTIVGNVDPTTLQPLVERYLASLPSKGKKETWRPVNVKRPKGKVEKQVKAGSEPKSIVHMSFSTPMPYTLEGDDDAAILRSVLQIRLREILREDMGGVYSVGVRAFLSREPVSHGYMRITFGCSPDNVAKLKDATFAELARIASSGVDEAVLTTVKELLRRQHETELAENDWWVGALREWAKYKTDIASMTDIQRTLARVTTANVQATARKLFDANNYIFVSLVPATSSSAPQVAPQSPPAPSPTGSTSSRPDSAAPPP